MILSTSVILLSAAGCRSWIMEDRTACPTFVFIDTDITGAAVPEEADVHVDIHDKAYHNTYVKDTVTAFRLKDAGYYAEVPKQEYLNVEGLAGFNGLVRDGDRWTIPEGSNGAPYYWFKSMVPGAGEQTYVHARFTKEYSKFNIQFIFDVVEFPYAVTVSANTNGIDISTGEPTQGRFIYEAREGARTGQYSFIVPRQRDNTLRIKLHRRSENTPLPAPGVMPMTDVSGGEDPAQMIGDLYLWEYLRQIEGFSWEMENLVDVNIEINYVLLTVSVAVEEWDSVETFAFRM